MGKELLRTLQRACGILSLDFILRMYILLKTSTNEPIYFLWLQKIRKLEVTWAACLVLCLWKYCRRYPTWRRQLFRLPNSNPNKYIKYNTCIIYLVARCHSFYLFNIFLRHTVSHSSTHTAHSLRPLQISSSLSLSRGIYIRTDVL